MENLDLLTSRLLIALARLIEGTEDVCLLPVVGTIAMPKRQRPEYDEFDTRFQFTMMTGRHDAFSTLLIN
ncbi:hypothetical protein V5E97_06020 [Singulisphaera sp. Ch08]|uniref:Uncharacterized protein n=1 Tax=Singulisphaera sp. Ch08 TaxID=3120278 RepID=A0AAU7CJZ8_9BACT